MKDLFLHVLISIDLIDKSGYNSTKQPYLLPTLANQNYITND
jgi:hypothetical protein